MKTLAILTVWVSLMPAPNLIRDATPEALLLVEDIGPA